MKDVSIDAVKMVREIRDKHADEFWKNQSAFLKKINKATERAGFHAKKRKQTRVA
jgi:ABC-type Zn uptake system ZnuABC Zn-binding protein ZnuA